MLGVVERSERERVLNMTTMTTSKWLTPVAVLVLAGVTWLWATRGGAAPSGAATQSAPVTAATAQPDSDATAAPAPAHTPTPAPDPQARIRHDAYLSAAARAVDRYRCVDTDERSCEFNSTAASSEAEALWLAQHGYPSQADLEEYPALSVPQLDARAAHDPAFAALRARRRIEDGELGVGLTQLMNLTKRGNLYALYEMSRAYRNKDIYDSAAYLRLAYLFGDRRAATELYAQFSTFDMPMLNVVDKRAADLRLKMFPGMPVQPRPFE